MMMTNLLKFLFLYWKILLSLLSIFLPLFPSNGPHRCVIPNADCGHQLQLITADLHGKRWNNLAIALGKAIASAKDEAHSVKSDIFYSTLRNLGCFLYIESFASARWSICDDFARNTTVVQISCIDLVFLINSSSYIEPGCCANMTILMLRNGKSLHHGTI
jgi:hypothetical protein